MSIKVDNNVFYRYLYDFSTHVYILDLIYDICDILHIFGIE